MAVVPVAVDMNVREALAVHGTVTRTVVVLVGVNVTVNVTVNVNMAGIESVAVLAAVAGAHVAHLRIFRCVACTLAQGMGRASGQALVPDVKVPTGRRQKPQSSLLMMVADMAPKKVVLAGVQWTPAVPQAGAVHVAGSEGGCPLLAALAPLGKRL